MLRLCGKTFTPQDSFKSLESLGISQGSELTFCRLSVLEASSGARIAVKEAGSDEFNGTYVGVSEESWMVDTDQKGHVYFQKEGTEGEGQCICWYRADLGWPSGWYMESNKWNNIASYFIESSDMTCLPMTNWFPYEAKAFSNPGMEPAPMLVGERKEEVPEPEEMDDGERKAYAMKLKEAGNEAFKAQDYATALKRYNDGANYITFDPSFSGYHGNENDRQSHGPEWRLSDDEQQLALALLNNSAMARLKMDDALGAKFDCCKALTYDADNLKAAFRLALSELALGNFSGCVDSAGRVLELDSGNREAEQLRRRGLAAMKKSAKEKEKVMCSKMFGRP